MVNYRKATSHRLGEKRIKSIKEKTNETYETSLTGYQKSIIVDMVRADFEVGLPQNDVDELRSLLLEDEDFDEGSVDDAVDYYFELTNLDPIGCSTDYITEYKSLEEDFTDDVDFTKVASHIEEAYNLIKFLLPKNQIARKIDYIFEDWLTNDWYDDQENLKISPRVKEAIEFLKITLLDKESKDYFNYGDLYDEIYDLLF